MQQKICFVARRKRSDSTGRRPLLFAARIKAAWRGVRRRHYGFFMAPWRTQQNSFFVASAISANGGAILISHPFLSGSDRGGCWLFRAISRALGARIAPQAHPWGCRLAATWAAQAAQKAVHQPEDALPLGERERGYFAALLRGESAPLRAPLLSVSDGAKG
jgi:hypothetical protein